MNFLNTIKSLNRNSIYFPQVSSWIFIAVFIIISFFYNYQDILFKPPQSSHRWRQADCLSITASYFKDNNAFIEPSTYNLGRDGTGKTVSDFPLIYYTVGKIWKITGQNEFIYRLIILLIFFSGLFTFYKLIEDNFKDSVIAILVALLLFTSPTLVYYANNFLMDIPAFSFALIALFFFYKYYKTKKFLNVYLMMFFYTLAGLLKISSLLSFFAIGGLFLLELFNVRLKKDDKVFEKKLRFLILFASVLVIELLWYSYAQRYNLTYNSGFFLIGTLPIWEVNMEQIKNVLDPVKEHIKWDYFRRGSQLIFLMMFFSIILSFRKFNKSLLYLNILLSIGFLSFIMLFFQAFRDHDYYTINLYIVIPVVLFSFLLLINENYPGLFQSLFFKSLLLIFLLYNIDFAERRIEDRYDPAGKHNKEYYNSLKTLTELEPKLDSFGINQDDKILSLSDNSINISLYMLNRKGWTDFGMHLDSARIYEKVKMGAKYIFIYNEKTKEEPGVEPYLYNKIGEYKNIEIYKL